MFLFKDYFPIYFIRKWVLQVSEYKTGNWLNGGGRTEEAEKLGTLVSEQVSPIFPWDIDPRFIMAVELGRNSDSRCVNYFLLLLVKSYKKEMANSTPKAQKRGKQREKRQSVLCLPSSLVTSWSSKWLSQFAFPPALCESSYFPYPFQQSEFIFC